MQTSSARFFLGRIADGVRLSPGAIARAAFLAAAMGFATKVDAVQIEMVTVGNPGNASDTTGYGGVAYSYQIGKYEVTIGQYTDFLNAAAKSDPYGLYNSNMGTNLNLAGISRAGAVGSYTYSVIGSSVNKPIAFVSWFDAARFANWMQNGQGSGSTEIGAYTLAGGTGPMAPARNQGAQFYVPTEHEWYKAAYYSPVKGGLGSAGYYAFATQSNSPPGNVVGGGANQANYYRNSLLSVTQSASYSSSQNYLADVGAFTNSASYYGTFDQTGNLYEWNMLDGATGSPLGIRGGSWQNDDAYAYLSSSSRFLMGPAWEDFITGFRLAAPVAPVPEPSTCAMAVAGLACGGWQMFRRRRA